MRARLLVFPIRRRNWCFSRSIQPSSLEAQQSQIPSTLKDLWNKIYSSPGKKFTPSNAELLIDFASNKMNNGWIALEKAPTGSIKNKIHAVGLRLLSRVKPSEIFLKSISKEVTKVEIMYPSRVFLRYLSLHPFRGWKIFGVEIVLRLNARLVRRRLRHIALRGTVIHKKYFYGSVTLLPLTSVFSVLPLPNIPFFWILFRSYSHWRALQGSEKLLHLVSNSENHESSDPVTEASRIADEATQGEEDHNSIQPLWVLHPSKELEEHLRRGNINDGLSKCIISDICESFNLNAMEVLKYEKSL